MRSARTGLVCLRVVFWPDRSVGRRRLVSGRRGGPGGGALHGRRHPRLSHAPLDRRGSAGRGRPAAGRPPGGRGLAPRVPLQGRLALRRDGGVHAEQGLHPGELSPGAARAELSRADGDRGRTASATQGSLQGHVAARGRRGGDRDRRDRAAARRLQRHVHHAPQEPAEGRGGDGPRARVHAEADAHPGRADAAGGGDGAGGRSPRAGHALRAQAEARDGARRGWPRSSARPRPTITAGS